MKKYEFPSPENGVSFKLAALLISVPKAFCVKFPSPENGVSFKRRKQSSSTIYSNKFPSPENGVSFKQGDDYRKVVDWVKPVSVP